MGSVREQGGEGGGEGGGRGVGRNLRVAASAWLCSARDALERAGAVCAREVSEEAEDERDEQPFL